MGFSYKKLHLSKCGDCWCDISAEKLGKLRNLNIYNELVSADITTLKFNDEFDAILAIEVLHGLGNIENFLSNIEVKLAKKGLI